MSANETDAAADDDDPLQENGQPEEEEEETPEDPAAGPPPETDGAQRPATEPGDFKTLEQFIIERQKHFPHSTGAFSRLLRDVSVAAKIVNRDMRTAGLIDIYGSTGEVNVQGEVQ
ncbi:MAG: hypothetical protein BRD40_02255, partial [Bacteroidetes bacterium QS_1_65_9]